MRVLCPVPRHPDAACRLDQIPPQQIAEDLAQLAQISKCVRTYSVQNGMDRVPELAEKVGLKVIQGIWLGSNRFKNLAEIATVVDLTKQYPGVITAVVVGNEVLLRGEMTAADLAATIRQVKSQVKVPVTYADVWEYWLRHRDVYDAVDFVTIHILPYWEDLPIRAKYAAAHVDSIRKRVAVAFPNKEILIGETGWPSAGRMREGALPSRASQALVVSEILSLAKREKYRVNLIEAYDQPWKRQLEGTVGGYWGLIDAEQRALKYPAGQPVSNYPLWKIYLGCGLGLSILVFGAGMLALRRRPWSPRLLSWLAVTVSATAGGILFGIAVDKMIYESLGRWRLGDLGRTARGRDAGADPGGERADLRPAAADLPRTDRPARGPHQFLAGARTGPEPDDHRGDRRDDRARLRLRPALPRFPLCVADHGGAAVLRPGAAEPAAIWRAADRRSDVCRCVRGGGCLYACSTRGRKTGSRSGPVPAMPCWRLRCGRRGASKTHDQQSDRQSRQNDVVEHDAEVPPPPGRR